MLTVTVSVKGRRQEYKEQTRAAVLDAAQELFTRRGFTATTIDEVAAAARISKGAVYHHFADKAQLFEAVFRARQTQLLGTVGRAAARRTDPWEQFDGALVAYLDGTVADPAQRALLQQAPVALGAARCREIDEQLAIPALLTMLDSLKSTGELAQEPTEMLARVVFSALCEAAMTAGADPHPTRARTQAETVLRSITAGLRRRS